MKMVFSNYSPSNELNSSGVELNSVLAIPLIFSQEHPTFVRIGNPIPHGWQNPVANCSFQAPLRYKTGRSYRASSLRRKITSLIFSDVQR